MEIPTPPNAHRALVGSATYIKDKRTVFMWTTGVLATAAVAGVGWVATHMIAAESINEQQEIRLKSVEDRAVEDRQLIHDQLSRQSDKLDRIMERIK